MIFMQGVADIQTQKLSPRFGTNESQFPVCATPDNRGLPTEWGVIRMPHAPIRRSKTTAIPSKKQSFIAAALRDVKTDV